MRSRRIVLSDDEDGDDEARRTDSMGISTPASSTEFLRELSGLNMRSGSRTGEATKTSQSTESTRPLSGNKSGSKGGIAIHSGEEDCFGSADELDPDSIIRTMHGKEAGQSQEEADYEAMIKPISRSGKSLYFPPLESSRGRSTERGESLRNNHSTHSTSHNHSHSTKKGNSHSSHGRNSAPMSPGRHVPRRESAVRAEQRLQSMYSEYGKQNGDGRADDTDYSDGDGDGSTEDAQHRSNGGSDDHNAEDEVGSDDFVVSDHDSDVPRHGKSKGKSKSSHPAGHSHSKGHHKGDGTSSDAAAESPRSSTRRSVRSASLSSRKQQQYLRAYRDIQQKSRSGLDAVLMSSSDDEVSDQHSDEYWHTDYDRSHKQSTQVGNSSSRASPPHRSSQTRTGSSSQRRQSHEYDSSPAAESPRRSSNSRSAGNKKGSKTQYSYSVSQLKSPAKCVGLMYRNDERGERDVDDDSQSDLGDFIVNSDEERAEEEARAEEAAYRKELRKQQRREEKARRNPHNSQHTGHKAAEIVASATAAYNRESKLSSRSHVNNSSGAGVQTNVHDDDSEDGEVVHITSRHSQRSSNSGDQGVHSGRKRKVILDSGDEEEDQGYLPDESAPSKRRKSIISGPAIISATSSGNGLGTSVHSSGMFMSASASRSGGVKRGNSAQSGGVIDLCNDAPEVGNLNPASRRRKHEPEPELDEESSQHSGSGEGSEGLSEEQEGSDSTDASDTGSGSGSEEDEDEELDGPMLYHKVNSMMDKQAENGDVSVFSNMRKRFPMAEAFAHYITLLANVLVDPDFLDNCHHPTGSNHSQGVHGSGVGNSGRKSKKERREEAIQRGNYLSATRQIENLICTNRESLIGSGAWNKEFYAELQSRPFYSSVKTMMCAETKSFGTTGDSGDEEAADDKVRCAACNRETQRPDIQVFLFGSTYDARQVWNSSRWDAPLPQELFLYRPPDEDCSEDDHMNDRASSNSSSRHAGRTSHTLYAPTPSSAPRNKQFQAYQTIRSGNISRYGDKLTVTGASGSGGGHKLSSKLRPDEDMAEAWQAQQARKRKTIVLSDGSSDSDTQQGGGKRTKMCRDTQQEQEELRRIAEASARAREQQLADEQRVRAWWKQKFPRELTKEPETAFFLSYHCKNRTRLYHTLLHYKFRLLLTIREKIQRTANALAAENGDRRTASRFDTSWEDWATEDRDILLRTAVEEVVQDQGFVEQETRRFETLIRETERRYGGRSEPPHDIWGDEDQYHHQHDHNNAAGSNSSGGNKEAHMSQQTKTIVGWLVKQSKK